MFVGRQGAGGRFPQVLIGSVSQRRNLAKDVGDRPQRRLIPVNQRETDDVLVGPRLVLRHQAEQGLEGDVTAVAAVVAEDEFVQVSIDVWPAGRAA